MLTLVDGSATMTTLEMVDFLNEIREDGEPVRHDNLMRKVRTYLADAAALMFEGSYVAADGSTRPCLALKKREAVLLAGTYSYKIAAAVYDRMTELEQSAQELHVKLKKLEAEKRDVLIAFDRVKSFGLMMREHYIQNHADRMVDLALKRNPKINAWGLHRQYVLQARRDNTYESPEVQLAEQLTLEMHERTLLENADNSSADFPALGFDRADLSI